MIKAIIFDIGGVLIDLYPSRCAETFKNLCGFDTITDYLDPCHQRGFIKEFEAGAITPEEFRDECRKRSRPGTGDEDIDRSFCSLLCEKMDPEKADCLKRLNGQGYDLYLLSNNNPIIMKRTEELFAEAGVPFETYFKDLFISCDMKMMKPNPEIYREAIRRIGRPRSELLFIDDSPLNVQAAHQRNIASALYVCGTPLGQCVFSALE